MQLKIPAYVIKYDTVLLKLKTINAWWTLDDYKYTNFAIFFLKQVLCCYVFVELPKHPLNTTKRIGLINVFFLKKRARNYPLLDTCTYVDITVHCIYKDNVKFIIFNFIVK